MINEKKIEDSKRRRSGRTEERRERGHHHRPEKNQMAHGNGSHDENERGRVLRIKNKCQHFDGSIPQNARQFPNGPRIRLVQFSRREHLSHRSMSSNKASAFTLRARNGGKEQPTQLDCRTGKLSRCRQT